jgi:peptide/nickel transport system substrate-binding protein
MAMDAVGQRLTTLLFSALTRVTEDLEVAPDLASSWSTSADGKRWVFEIRSDAKDHDGNRITSGDLARCLEEYRSGLPASRMRSAFPGWRETRALNDHALELVLEKPDPYLARNISSLRYFRLKGAEPPCVDPESPLQREADHAEWVGSGPYRLPQGGLGPDAQGFAFRPVQAGYLPVEFLVVRDELQRVMRLIRGEADAAQNAISLTKTRWLVQKYPERFHLVEREGVNVSYLAFNLRDPILSKRAVREALSRSVPRDTYILHKMAGFGTRAGSLLSPLLRESRGIDFMEDLPLANRLLDEAGHPRGPGGARFTLKYRTTPAREGFETALVLQDAFERIGVTLELDIVEPAAFLSAIRKGAFQLYSSRWVGVADGSILNRTMKSGTQNNRVGYMDAEADRMLDVLMENPSTEERLQAAARVQQKMMEDLPYFPLWFWGNALIINKERDPGIRPEELSLSGALEPLVRALSRKKNDKGKEVNP